LVPHLIVNNKQQLYQPTSYIKVGNLYKHKQWFIINNNENGFLLITNQPKSYKKVVTNKKPKYGNKYYIKDGTNKQPTYSIKVGNLYYIKVL
jgi:hypothetical protein